MTEMTIKEKGDSFLRHLQAAHKSAVAVKVALEGDQPELALAAAERTVDELDQVHQLIGSVGD